MSDIGIINAVVASGSIILAEKSLMAGNFAAITKKLISAVGPSNPQGSLPRDQYYFHYTYTQGLTFACIARSDFGTRIPFAFLADIKQRFMASFDVDSALTATHYQYNNEFARTLQNQMKQFNSSAQDDRLTQVRSQVADVNEQVVQTMNTVIQRGGRLESIQDRAEALRDDSHTFQTRAGQVRRAVWFRDLKIQILLAVVAVVLLYIIISCAACGGITLPKCVKKKTQVAEVAAIVVDHMIVLANKVDGMKALE